MNQLGDNNPPDMTITAGEVTKDLAAWMSEIPIIETEDQAREAKLWADRAYLCVQDLEDERKEKKRPYREIVEKIDAHYKYPRELLERVLGELKSRLSRYLLVEKVKKDAAEEEAREAIERSEERARLAEQELLRIQAEAAGGVLGGDIAEAAANLKQAQVDLGRDLRRAALIENEKIKIGGGIRPASSLRSTEVPCIVDPLQVIEEVGITQDMEVALIKAARAFKRLHGRYPRGITITIERGI